MKNYRKAAPIFIIVFMVLSIYMLYDSYAKINSQYNGYLNTARSMSADGIVSDALSNYQEALALQDTLEIRMEAGEMLSQAGNVSEAISWGEDIISAYPKNPEGYVYLLNLYISQMDYKDCFELSDDMSGRKVYSEEFDTLMKTVEYQYEVSYCNYTKVGEYASDYCPVFRENLWGYVGLKGTEVIERNYTEVGPFFSYTTSDGIEEITASVTTQEGERYFIDPDGNKKHIVKNISNCTFLGSISDNVLVAADGDAYAYYDIEFNKLSEDYQYATVMNGGLAVIQREDCWYLVNDEYEILSEAYDGFFIDTKQIATRCDRAFASKDGKYYLLNETGQKVTETAYDDVKLFATDEYAAVELNGKWGFIDTDGNIVIEPMYENAYSFNNGLGAVCSGGKWGYITEDNELVIDYAFDDAGAMNSAGNAFVKQNGVWNILKLYKYNY